MQLYEQSQSNQNMIFFEGLFSWRTFQWRIFFQGWFCLGELFSWKVSSVGFILRNVLLKPGRFGIYFKNFDKLSIKNLKEAYIGIQVRKTPIWDQVKRPPPKLWVEGGKYKLKDRARSFSWGPKPKPGFSGKDLRLRNTNTQINIHFYFKKHGEVIWDRFVQFLLKYMVKLNAIKDVNYLKLMTPSWITNMFFANTNISLLFRVFNNFVNISKTI